MKSGRLLRVGFMVATGALILSACDKQGATVGPYPSTTISATPSMTPSGGITSSPSPSPSTSASATATATASASAIASSSPSSAIGPLTITPDPINFTLTSILGATQTAQIAQMGYTGPFTLPANSPVVCANGTITTVPVTATISGSTLSVTLGALGVTGSCVITVDGAPGTSGTETVNLAVPIGTPPSSGPLTFVPNPINFNVLNGVLGNTATTTVSEMGYTGVFSLPANAVSCPFNLVPLTMLSATISGNVVTVTTGTLNANLLGSCNVTVDDAMGNSGSFVVNFELL